ncbi:MAG TPA: hypothetical protein VF776_03580 [Sphingomicrobium sp.]
MRRADSTRTALFMLLGAALLVSGCGQSAPQQQGSITVRLPPAQPYRRAAVKPGFSEPLTGLVRG